VSLAANSSIARRSSSWLAPGWFLIHSARSRSNLFIRAIPRITAEWSGPGFLRLTIIGVDHLGRRPGLTVRQIRAWLLRRE
jgi:hypothetical protein